jgi:hypothetical protein
MANVKDDPFASGQLRTKIFAAVCAAIDPAAHEGLMEIELLGPALFPTGEWVLRDGNAVAMSKLGLRAAYLEALADLERLTGNGHGAEGVPLRLRSLAPLVLLNTEHVTAMHWRKESLRSIETDAEPGLARYKRMIMLEKRFIDSLLTSPLNQHNKSPTVWAHRRWLVPRLARLGMQDIVGDITKVVMLAGERHPRNYYAWHHARYLMTFVDWSTDTPMRNELLRAVVDWCCRHHDDISGWSFLQSLLLTDGRYDSKTVSDVFKEVLGLASLLRWANESVWVFLRTMAASRVLGQHEYDEFRKTCGLVLEGAKDDLARRVLQAASSWARDYRQCPGYTET